MIRRGDWLQSWSIGQLWPLDMRPEDIRIADIGNALSKLCRFSGHVHHYYSVAQHCVLVSLECERRARAEDLTARRVLDYARWGHAHDWTEGLGLVDLARPLKRLPEFTPYREIEARMMVPLSERFGLSGVTEPSMVKEVDQALCYTEARDLFPAVHPEWVWHAAPLPQRILPHWWTGLAFAARALFRYLAPPATIRALDRALAWHVLTTQQALTLFRARFEELWPEEKWR